MVSYWLPLLCTVLCIFPVSHLSPLIVLSFVLVLSFPPTVFLYFPLIFYLINLFHADFLIFFCCFYIYPCLFTVWINYTVKVLLEIAFMLPFDCFVCYFFFIVIILWHSIIVHADWYCKFSLVSSYEELSEVLLSNQVPLYFMSHSNSGLQGPPFSLSIVHIIPWNSSNGVLDKGHIWVWSTMKQAESKMQ